MSDTEILKRIAEIEEEIAELRAQLNHGGPPPYAGCLHKAREEYTREILAGHPVTARAIAAASHEKARQRGFFGGMSKWVDLLKGIADR